MKKQTLSAVGIAALVALGVATIAGAQAGTLFVRGENVGIGNATPTTRLQVDSSSANSNVILVRSTDGQTMMRFFETLSTGGVMSMYDSVGNEDFRISATGDSWFSSAGDVGIDCTSPDHDLTIGGSGVGCDSGVYSEIDAGEAQFTTSSSRSIKENLVPVKVNDVLSRIDDVRVYNYDFISGPQDRIGLMAEDFHTIFGRGTETELSGQEVQMALWLAVQELTEQNRKLSDRVAVLEAQRKTTPSTDRD